MFSASQPDYLYNVEPAPYLLINVKKTYQFKTHGKDDVMISLH